MFLVAKNREPVLLPLHPCAACLYFLAPVSAGGSPNTAFWGCLVLYGGEPLRRQTRGSSEPWFLGRGPRMETHMGVLFKPASDM